MGTLAESYGLRQGIKYRGAIKDALETVLRIDPAFQNGSADRALGRWYFKVPGLFGGSKKKSEEHLRKSLTYDPEQHRVALLPRRDALRHGPRRGSARGAAEGHRRADRSRLGRRRSRLQTEGAATLRSSGPIVRSASATDRYNRRLRTSHPALTALRHRNFRLIWIGLLLSFIGSFMQNAALLWHVSLLVPPDQKGLALGAVGLVRVVPIIVFSMISGVVADAWDRRRLMLMTQTRLRHRGDRSRIARVQRLTSVWPVYALAALSSAVGAFDLPARQSLVPSLVPREDLPNAISLNTIMQQTAQVLGRSEWRVHVALVVNRPGCPGVFRSDRFFPRKRVHHAPSVRVQRHSSSVASRPPRSSPEVPPSQLMRMRCSRRRSRAASSATHPSSARPVVVPRGTSGPARRSSSSTARSRSRSPACSSPVSASGRSAP